MKKYKYRYDVDLINSKTGRKIKRVKEQIVGSELKKYQSSLRNMADNRELRIYKTTIGPDGKSVKKLHRTERFGIEESIHNIFKNTNFHYRGVDIDYDMRYNCAVEGCDSICRCGRIESPRVESIDLNYLISELISEILKITKSFKLKINDVVLTYCVERLLRHSGLQEGDNYDIQYGPSYYGDEIEGVYYYDEGLIRDIANVIRASSIDAAKITLEREYGYLLTTLKDLNSCSVKKVKRYELVVPNKEYYVRLDKKLIEQYSKYAFPIGVYIEDDGKYRLVDGYHRYRAFIDSNRKECEIVVLS